jgi:hypothetical protein
VFLGMLFVAAAIVGAMLVAFKDDPATFASPAFSFARTLSYSIVNVYMVRMAGVFMMSTSTVANVHAFRASLAGRAGLPAGSLATARQSFPALELRALSPMGAFVECPYPGEQSWPAHRELKPAPRPLGFSMQAETLRGVTPPRARRDRVGLTRT